MHLPALISDLAIILLTGGVVTLIFRKLNQPLVLGYILAGFLIGPYLPFFFTVADAESISTWSEIGIIILMFGLGLEFNLHKLVSVGGTGIITALTEVAGMLIVGYLVGQAMGWGEMDSLFLGGMLSMSSTTIIIKAFDDLKVRQEPFAQLVFGTLVIEDIAGIFMMIILSTISVGQSVSGAQLAFKLGMLVLYLALWLLAGIYLLPTALKKATPLMSDETLLVVSLGLCFGMVLLADALGFSSALGAFLAGSLLAGTVQAERVEHLTQGVKDLFGAVFFISVGMMVDPAMIARHIVPILLLSAVTVVGKLSISSLGVLLSGQSLRTAIHCGCSLAQIGEFAFIIASLGLSLGVIADYIYPIIIAVSIITTLTTPFFIQHADGVFQLVNRLLPQKLSRKLERYTDAPETAAQDSEWAAYLRRYFKLVLLYGVIMAGINIIGRHLVLPLLDSVLPGTRPARLVVLALIYVGMALFIRPMLDTRSTAYTTLWMKSRGYHLPLMALSALRLLLIVLLFFLPLRQLLGVSSLWLLPVILAAVLLASRMGWLASAYLRIEARFLANLNERQLSRFSDSDAGQLWLDEQLHVDSLPCPDAYAGQSLQELAWGKRYGVNIIRLVHGRRRRNMPSGRVTLMGGDTATVIGTQENLRSLRLALGLEPREDTPTLRAFIAAQDESDANLYSYALPIEKGSALDGSTIKASAIRENYDCMVLGLQRDNLPLVQPDINMVMQSGDLVWILGTRTMAAKVLAE
ncbi:MAG: cation:proton antiporter [Oscillospiraceae bacterium]|nr:cation:proton antiporter [Oscillospiraceae bacterium]